ncbi:hypothetical protein N0V83_002347 [Neocucurbitaria cava]|uniref:Kinetochore protein mis14 n=1 Tax=Neocucurbitaria cava TaxID=798079 RepID=A0A9W9CPU8_9PLEO|nr:hypothetical protein N0V83_002347 [Neocucurbitaria cava]
MDTAHRKIELQSPSDLTFLTSQIRTAARQKLDLHLPPVSSESPNEPDELRKHVEDLVDAFVAQVLNAMRHNISINGIDVVAAAARGEGDGNGEGMESMEGVVISEDGESQVEKEDFEPFNDKLRGKLSATVQKRDALIAKISAHRRGTPAAAAEKWKALFEAESQALAAGEDNAQGEDVVVDLEAMKRADEVQRNWERAVEGLGKLNKGLPETRARLERCGEVVGYLGGEGKN